VRAGDRLTVRVTVSAATNTFERGHQYAARDMLGCMGRWFAGRWYTQPARSYMNTVQGHVNNRTWQTPEFLNYNP
jgi:hypothetical protein